ncbi:Guanine nucleotide-binding protein G(S) subunit alpha [Paragonimus heterotremus]|uniref:Guanine nucleotide-binding protein alpha-13 subunit n=1 Tax=Paragonimus heterotremus TaxID=100268 RepID=A0A8J4TQ35_9TREM|nr:Guanine nucleotide-binding protein G(S) subunit alpha [Paragonimus heterotremus]
MTLLCCCGAPESTENSQEQTAKAISRSINRQLKEAQKSEWKCLKLLLLGTGESGKSTILKQMKIIHINGYTEQEKLEFVPHVYKNIRDAMLSLLGGMRVLGVPLRSEENVDLAQRLLEGSSSDEFIYSRAFFDAVEKLWRDQGVQNVFTKANEYQLLDSAKYFLDRIDVIRQDGYIPSEQDILRCRTMTDGINEIQFDIRTGRKNSVHFRVFDVSGQRGARKKWIQLFDSVTAILFLVDSSSFDQVLREDRTQNRLMDSLEVFEQAWNNKYLQSVPVIVFINKIDVLDEKIHLGQRINKLYSFAANWLDTYEMRKFCLSSNDSKEQCNSSFHESMLSCYSQASVNLDNAVFQSTNSYFPTSTPLRKIDEDNSVDVASSELNSSLAIRTQRSPSDKSMQSRSSRLPSQSSFRWRKNSFNRTLSALAPKNSIRRFRRSFRQAAFLPVNATPASCGQTSRLSCTATVARVILEMPYHKFQPSPEAQCKFSNEIQYIEHQTIGSNGVVSQNLRELRPPHRETVRTACYIKHLFEELTKQSVSSLSDCIQRRHCLFYYTCAVNTDSVKKVLDGCRTFLIEDHLERFGLL